MSGPKIGITGSYGGMNLGDEAILQSMIEQVRREMPGAEVTVFSRNAEDTKRRHKVERAVPVRKLSRAEVVPEVERLDLLLFGGGGILYDAEARIYLREVLIAKEHGVPVMLFAVGAGPLKDPTVQAAVREALDGVAAITVRERSAQQCLEECEVHQDVIVTADPALLLKPEPLPRNALKFEGLDGRSRVIGMSVREPGVAAPDLPEQVDPRARRRVLLQRPVRSVAVVVIGVLTQDQPQVPLAGDQHPVQALAAGTGDPAFGDGVRARRLDRGLDDPHADGGDHRSGRGGELGVPVMSQKLEAVSLFCEVHEQVAGLLGHPRAGGAGSEAGQAHPAGAVLEEEQHIQAAQEHGVDVEEVRCPDGLGLTGQERPPSLPGSPGRGFDARVLEDQPNRRRRDRVAKAGPLAVDAPVSCGARKLGSDP